MKRNSIYSKKELRIIILGYLFRWAILGMIIMPLIVGIICKTLNIEVGSQKFVTSLSFFIAIFLYGLYWIIGTLCGFKHILIAMQLAYHAPFQNLRPNDPWTPSERRESILCGALFAVLGLAAIIVVPLEYLGII